MLCARPPICRRQEQEYEVTVGCDCHPFLCSLRDDVKCDRTVNTSWYLPLTDAQASLCSRVGEYIVPCLMQAGMQLRRLDLTRSSTGGAAVRFHYSIMFCTCMLTGPGSLILMTLAARSFALTVLVRARADFLPCKGSMLRYDQALGAMCFLLSFARLTCLSFASQQQYAALLPCMVEEHGQARASSRCTACPSGFSGLLQQTGLPV